MDLVKEVESMIEGMNWDEVFSILHASMHDELATTFNPPPPPPHPPVPAGLELNIDPQPVDSQGGGYGTCVPLKEAPATYAGDIVQPAPLCSQAGVDSQGRYQWSGDDAPTEAAVSQPAAPPQTCLDVPEVRLPDGRLLQCVEVLNGEMLYKVIAEDFTAPVSAAPPLNAFNSKERKRESQQEEGRPYVKKPPNAFMLFMKEQRSSVQAKLNTEGRGSAAVNTVLGQMWKSLTKEEQDKYYSKAQEERLLHARQHPEWSSTDNYGKKRKRQRSKFPARVEASASEPKEDTHQAKKPCVSTVQTAVMEPPSSQAAVMEPRHPQTVLVYLPNSDTAVTVPVCDRCHLPQVYGVSPASWPESADTASTSLASAAAPTQTQTESTRLEDVGGQVSPSDGADCSTFSSLLSYSLDT